MSIIVVWRTDARGVAQRQLRFNHHGSPAPAVSRGEEVALHPSRFARKCLSCHDPGGSQSCCKFVGWECSSKACGREGFREGLVCTRHPLRDECRSDGCHNSPLSPSRIVASVAMVVVRSCDSCLLLLLLVRPMRVCGHVSFSLACGRCLHAFAGCGERVGLRLRLRFTPTACCASGGPSACPRKVVCLTTICSAVGGGGGGCRSVLRSDP